MKFYVVGLGIYYFEGVFDSFLFVFGMMYVCMYGFPGRVEADLGRYVSSGVIRGKEWIYSSG